MTPAVPLLPHPKINNQHKAAAMSNVPSRTRSVRKPGDSGQGSSRYGRSGVAESTDPAAVSRPADSKPAERSAHSPSRLPVKPRMRSSTTSTLTRPPSSSGTNNGGNASMRLPVSRPNLSKPGSLHISASNNRLPNPTAGSEPAKQDRSKPLPASRHLRNTSTSVLSATAREPGHSRTKSSSVLLTGSSAARPPSGAARATEDPTSRPLHADSQLRRPAFSTLQQHFSPAKSLAPKPHPAAFLAPPSPSKLPSNIAISAETAKLQSQLLQLHLLHKDVVHVEREWRASAKKKLGARFQHVVKKNQTLVRLEADETAKINAAALQRWQDLGTPGRGLDEKMQMLEEIVTGVWNLGESGGKYARVVKKFERWLSRCQRILEARDQGIGLDDEVVFVEELDVGWKDDFQGLRRKLEGRRDLLKDLESPDKESSLASMVDRCQSLVGGMLMELRVMAQIERDAVRVEAGWIKTMNNGESDDGQDAYIGGAAWRQQ